MCLWLAVSTSGFYHWAIRPQSATAARREALIARIQPFFEESGGTHGYRRIHVDLAAEQTECSPELVRQIMRQIGLGACQPRPFRITTEPDAEAAATMPGLVKRDFTATRPGVKVVGWSIADHMRTELVANARCNAAATTLIEPDAIWHSDRGVGRAFIVDRTGRCCFDQLNSRRLHIDQVSSASDQLGYAFLDGPNRRVLGINSMVESFFLDDQERTRLPHRIRDEITSSQRRHPVYRRLLQQSTPAFRAGLSPAK